MNAYLTYDRIEERKWVAQAIAEEREDFIDRRAKEVLAEMPTDLLSLFLFSIRRGATPHEGLRSDVAIEAFNNLKTEIAYAQAEHDWEHRTGCPF